MVIHTVLGAGILLLCAFSGDRAAEPQKQILEGPWKRHSLRVCCVQVWNWFEVNKERDANSDDGAAGDHYYGAGGDLDLDPDVGLNEIIAEALNASPGVFHLSWRISPPSLLPACSVSWVPSVLRLHCSCCRSLRAISF
jgi:hypothetical protein